MSSCRNNCPVASGRAYKLPRHQLDAVRRKLEFSDEVSESPTGLTVPADKYGHFKKISESYSSQDIEPPMYASEQMADVPDSFLEWLGQQRAAPEPPAKKVTSVQTKETTEVQMPESFLEFCQERIEKRKYAPRSPSPAAAAPSPRRTSFFLPPQRTTPYNTSYYGYDAPGAARGMIFEPRLTSTPKTSIKSPSPYAAGGYYPFPQMGYYSGRAPSFYMEGCMPTAPRSPPAEAPGGIGKFAYPHSRSPQTPPTPSWLYGGARQAVNFTQESTVSSGDILQSCSPECAASRQHRNAGVEEYDTSRRDLSDTVCTDDLFTGNSNQSQRCPVLSVTPAHSSPSLCSSAGNIAERQKISKSIENELRAREEQERNQLETDLARWQQARRRLVLNTANMGA